MSCPECGDDPYEMHNAVQSFDTLDDTIERLTFVKKKLKEEPGKDHELICVLLVLAREVKALKEANPQKEKTYGSPPW